MLAAGLPTFAPKPVRVVAKAVQGIGIVVQLVAKAVQGVGIVVQVVGKAV